jgi:hypothetical protein
MGLSQSTERVYYEQVSKCLIPVDIIIKDLQNEIVKKDAEIIDLKNPGPFKIHHLS